MVCFNYFGFIRFFYTGRVPKGVDVTEAVTDPSKVLKKTGKMKKDILFSNLILLLKLSDFYQVAELKEIVEDAMIEKLDEGNYEEFLVGATVHGLHGGRRVKAAVAKFLSKNPAVFEEHLTKHASMYSLACDGQDHLTSNVPALKETSSELCEITKVTRLFLLKFEIQVIFGLMRLFAGETERREDGELHI